MKVMIYFFFIFHICIHRIVGTYTWLGLEWEITRKMVLMCDLGVINKKPKYGILHFEWLGGESNNNKITRTKGSQNNSYVHDVTRDRKNRYRAFFWILKGDKNHFLNGDDGIGSLEYNKSKRKLIARKKES